MLGGNGEARRHPGNSPGRGKGMRRRQSHGSGTEKFGGGAAAGDGGIPQDPQWLRGHHLVSEHLMPLIREIQGE